MSAVLWTAPLRVLAEPTFIEAWPASLRALAVPARGLPLAPDEAAALDQSAPLYRDRLGQDDAPGLHALAARMLPLLEDFDGSFRYLG
jgi:hypothetical protein